MKNPFPNWFRNVPNRGAFEKVRDLCGVGETLYNIAVGSFKWTGLPDGLPSWMLENFLFFYGQVAAFEDSTGGLMILPAYQADQPNKYYVYQRYSVFGMNFQKQISLNDCVLFWNNSAHSDSCTIVSEYADRINSINLTDMMNIRQLRFPWMFGGDEQQINSLKAALTQANENNFALFTTNSVQSALREGVGFQTGVSYLGDDLKKHRDDIYNEVLTLLGFDNTPITKKERLITDEAHANDMQINFFRQDRLKCRQEAAEEINKKFGTNISVEWTGGNIEYLTGRGDITSKAKAEGGVNDV